VQSRILLLLLLVNATGGLADVEFVEPLVVNLGEHAALEQAKQVPSFVERLEDSTVGILVLTKELTLELLKEDKEVLVIAGKRVLTDDSLHGEGVLAGSVERVHLREDGRMILSGQLVEGCDNLLIAIGVLDDGLLLLDTNSRLHQTGERGQDVDRRVDLPVVKRIINEDLALSDVASEIRDRMSDIRVGHSQDR